MSAPFLTNAPTHALILRLDTLGDFVLFTPVLRRLRAAWPDTRIHVVVRKSYLEIARIAVPGIEWIGIGIDSFSKGPAEVMQEATELVSQVKQLAPQVVIAATARRTWLESLLAGSLPHARSIALGNSVPDPFFSIPLKACFGVDDSRALSEAITVSDDSPDWMRNHEFVDRLLGEKTEPQAPQIDLPGPVEAQARTLLGTLGLEPGAYVVCAAAGHANVQIKTWPAESFAKIVNWLRSEHGIRTLFIGHQGERSYLESLCSKTAEAQSALWLGEEVTLPTLAALLGLSRFYLGNDTGAMHIAAATGRPVLAVFGGGTWPRFRPAAETSIELVQPLPCFGCGWDCAFGDAPCVKNIAVEDVKQALADLLRNPGAKGNRLCTVPLAENSTLLFIEKAASLAKERSEALRQRQTKLETTVILAREKDGEINALKAATTEKDKELLSKDKEIHSKDSEINALKNAANEKDAEINSLKAATTAKDNEIGMLKAATTAKDNEIGTLKAACNERLELINRLDKDVRTLVSERSKLSLEVVALRKQAATALAKAQETEERYTRLSPDAKQWADQLAAAINKSALLDQELGKKNEELHRLQITLGEKDNSLQNLALGLNNLECHKYYQQQLRAKEDVLQGLHRACQEREQLIAKMAADSTGLTKSLHRLWLGLREFLRLKVSLRLRQWTERRVLDGYWMQLGELRQHGPQPLAWDKLLLAPKRLPAEAPRIGIVTPSFNQARFLEQTIRSITEQGYPRLRYIIQDGGSTDASIEVMKRHAEKLHDWESAKDGGQADAIRRGFAKLDTELRANDVMAWVNSDDLLAPGSLAMVGRFFAAHPEIDVVYGHRIIIDEEGREIGRWVLPRHDPEMLRWIDFIPQETLFWRKRVWDRIGGLDPSFHFALDWDFLLRLEESGVHFHRLPFFLAAFRVHNESKTSSLIHTRGNEEMGRVRQRVHGAAFDTRRLDAEVRKLRFRGALSARLFGLGIRW